LSAALFAAIICGSFALSKPNSFKGDFGEAYSRVRISCRITRSGPLRAKRSRLKAVFRERSSARTEARCVRRRCASLRQASDPGRGRRRGHDYRASIVRRLPVIIVRRFRCRVRARTAITGPKCRTATASTPLRSTRLLAISRESCKPC